MKLETSNFIIEYSHNGIGFFEHKILGDELAGELIFDFGILVDYDGVSEIPTEVLAALHEKGIDVEGYYFS